MTTLIGIGGLPRSKGQAHIIADTLSAVVTNLNVLTKKSSLLGANILIRTMDVPDLWIDTVENTSVQYTYVSDAQMIADINSAYSTAQKGLQIGYYRVLPWEGAKIDLSEYRKAANQDIIDNALDARLDEIEGKESDWDGKYAKPSTGIPSSDMSSAVQTSLGKADSALQEVPDTYRPASEQNTIDEALAASIAPERTLAEYLTVLVRRVETLEGIISTGNLGNVKVDSIIIRDGITRYGSVGNEHLTGSGAPTVIPDHRGQKYYDLTGGHIYEAIDNTAVSNWKMTV